MLQKLHPASSATDHLFVGTDRYAYLSLSWDPSSKQLKTEKSYVDLADKTGRDSQSSDRCLIDPSRRYMMLELFEGILTVIPISHKQRKKGDIELGNLGDPVPVRIPELFVRSSAFLYPRNLSEKEKPKLALLYEDSHQKTRLIVRALKYDPGSSGEPGVADFFEDYHLPDDLDLGASHLIPVPAPACKLLLRISGHPI